MVSPCVVSRPPSRVYNGSLSDLHDAVTRNKAKSRRLLYQIDVSPLEAVIVYVVRYLAEDNALRCE
jgi:hypothetical protein